MKGIRRVLVVGDGCQVPELPENAVIRAFRTYEEARTELFRVQCGRIPPFDLAFIQRLLPDGDGRDLCRVFQRANGGAARGLLTIP